MAQSLQQSKLRADLTDARLVGLSMPTGAGWATAARKAALARVTAAGLPTKRDEYWKFTDPSSLTVSEPDGAALFDNDDGLLFDKQDRVKIVFVDGVLDLSASDDLAAGGIEIERLSVALSKDIHWAKDLYGVLEAKGQNPVARPLASLNTAFATDGVAIRVTGRAKKPVHLIYLREKTDSDAMLHNVVRIEAGGDFTLLETGPAAARFSKCLEVDIADGGAFHHVRVQGRDHERRALTHCFARVGAKATFKSFTMTFNGRLTRNECVIDIVGDNAIAHVAGACMGDGPDFHHDDTIFVTHDAVDCESRQVFKKVLCNGAVGVFQGKILVKAGAQRTDGYQISQSLLLGDDSQFLAKPELEIYADDVACSHGSTSGAIDEDALFYLRSRGVPEGQAANLLTLAFLAEALAEVEDASLADDLRARLERWLARHS